MFPSLKVTTMMINDAIFYIKETRRAYPKTVTTSKAWGVVGSLVF